MNTIQISDITLIDGDYNAEKNQYTIILKNAGQEILIQLNDDNLLELFEVVLLLSQPKVPEQKMKEHWERFTSMLIEQARNDVAISNKFGSLFIPKKIESDVFIYLPEHDISLFEAEKITNACGDFMEALGFELETEEEPIFSSFWKKIKFVLSKHTSAEEIDKLFSQGKKALELKHVDLPTAEQTEKLANSAEKIVNSLEKYDEGVVRLGSLLVLKKQVDGVPKLIIQQLNFDLIKLFDEKPQLLKNLQTTYEILTGQVKAQNLIDDSSASEEHVVV